MQLFNNFKKNKNKVALITDNGREFKFKDILELEKNFKKKIEKKQLVLILANNSVGSILFYILSILNQNKIMLIDENLNYQEISKIVELYQPNYIVSKIKKTNKKKNSKLILKLFDYSIIKTNFETHNLIKNLLILLPTSGSTGSSKFVQLSEKNIISNAKSISKYLKIHSKDRAITNMPFYYSYMLSILNSHLISGGSIYISNKTILEKKFWIEFRRKKITSFNGVPYTWEMLNRIGKEKIFTKYLRYITQAGGKLDKKLANEFYQLCKLKKKDMYIMYGQTEASPRIAYIKNENIVKHQGSIGKPIDGVKMWIENQKSIKILKPNNIGGIFISGDNVMMGYSSSIKDIKNKDTPNLKFEKLDTGDVGYFDKDGFFYITGRSNRIIKLYGNRVDLDEIERKMDNYNLKVVCISKNNNLVIFFSRKIIQKKIEKKLYEILKINISRVRFIKINIIPLTKNKKTNYKKLRELC
jgi:long-chain acyl-CoA synthetase